MARRRPRVGPASAVLMMAAIAACDIPTALPEWDTRWMVPAERTRLTVADLLPFDIIETADGFDIELPELSLTRSLGELCEPCAAANGLVVPKPPFTAEFFSEIPVSASIASARIEGGSVLLEVTHDLAFDPIRPGGAETGVMVLELQSDGVMIARDSIDGAVTALPPGAVLERELVLGAAMVSGAVDVVVTLNSPAGPPVEVTTEDRISVTLPTSTVAVDDLRLLVDDLIETEPLILELDAVDEGLRDRVRSARVHLEIDNPFDLNGDLTLRFSSPNLGIDKPVSLEPGEGEATIDLSREEIFSILTEPEVVITLSGPAVTPESGSAVEPGQELDVQVRLELVVASSS